MKCLICFEVIKEPLFLSNYFSVPPVLCEACRSLLQELEGRRCTHCWRKLLADEADCTDCSFMHRHFTPLDTIHVLYDYNDFMKELIHCYKGRGDVRLAAVFAELLRAQHKTIASYDCIIPLPTSEDKLNSRGFSQIEAILEESRYSFCQPLKMAGRTKQSMLTKRDRLQQENPFTVIAPVEGRVLIVDDIYTTGLTVHRAAEVLRHENVSAIGVLAFARP